MDFDTSEGREVCWGRSGKTPYTILESGLEFKSNIAKVYEAQNPCQAVSWVVVTNVELRF